MGEALFMNLNIRSKKYPTMIASCMQKQTKEVVLEAFYEDIAKAIPTEYFHRKSAHLHLTLKEKEPHRRCFHGDFAKKS